MRQLRTIALNMKVYFTLCLLLSLTVTATPLGAGITKAQQTQDSLNPITNQDVVQMVKAGLSSDVIIAKIKSSYCTFDTFPGVLQELRFQKVPNDVILEMVQAPHGPPKTAKSESRSRESTLSPVTFVDVTVLNGTPVEIEMAYTISSADLEEGNAVTFRVVHPIKVNGATVIERGAVATARVSKAKKGGSWGRAGQIAWAMQDVAAVDGSRIPLEFTKGTKGDSKGGTVTTGVIVTALLFWPAAPLWAFKHGKNAVVPAGKRFEVFVHGDTSLKGKAPIEDNRP